MPLPLPNTAPQSRSKYPPPNKGKPFKIPRLMSEIQGTLEFADTDVFMEYHDWSLLDYSPKMDEQEFTIHETSAQFCNRH